MVLLTKKVEYSLIALVYIDQKEGVAVSAREIAEHNAIPVSLTANILKTLARNGLVTTRRGAAGGYTLERGMEEIRIEQVMSAIEGPLQLSPCCRDLGETGCTLVGSCSIKSAMMALNKQMTGLIRSMSLREFLNLGHASPLASAMVAGSEAVSGRQS
jgi:Rrf2 family protein